MKARRVVLAGLVAMMFCGVRGVLAQGPPASSVADAACGAADMNVKSKADSAGAVVTSPPAGKALVFVLEQMPDPGVLTTHVRVGEDGTWLAQLESLSYTSVVVDPGVHHFCAVYQGKAVESALGRTMLHSVHAEAGKTYFLVYRGVIVKDGGEIAFFDQVDEDEGRFLLEAAPHMTTTVTKKTK